MPQLPAARFSEMFLTAGSSFVLRHGYGREYGQAEEGETAISTTKTEDIRGCLFFLPPATCHLY